MASDYGILITAPGTDVAGAPSNRVFLNTSNPFLKIDTQNAAGFKTITLLITTNPPEPPGGATIYTYTTLYSFKHNYSYIPSLETLFWVITKPPTAVTSQDYFQDSGVVGARTADDEASLYAVADAANVYIICRKYNSGAGLPNLLTGTTVQITTHVFVEDTTS